MSSRTIPPIIPALLRFTSSTDPSWYICFAHARGFNLNQCDCIQSLVASRRNGSTASNSWVLPLIMPLNYFKRNAIPIIANHHVCDKSEDFSWIIKAWRRVQFASFPVHSNKKWKLTSSVLVTWKQERKELVRAFPRLIASVKQATSHLTVVRESPDISQINGETDNWKEKVDFLVPSLPWFLIVVGKIPHSCLALVRQRCRLTGKAHIDTTAASVHSTALDIPAINLEPQIWGWTDESGHVDRSPISYKNCAKKMLQWKEPSAFPYSLPWCSTLTNCCPLRTFLRATHYWKTLITDYNTQCYVTVWPAYSEVSLVLFSQRTDTPSTDNLLIWNCPFRRFRDEIGDAKLLCREQ